MPATKATVRFTMAPTSAAVSAKSSRSGLTAWGRELDQEDGGDDADLPRGEVEDPVGAVDQDQADRQQAVAESDDDALEDHAARCREGQHSHGDLAQSRRGGAQEDRPQEVVALH